MYRTGAMFFQRREVLGSSIALMLRKTVIGVKRVPLDHQAIPRDLRNHARGRDAVTQSVATHERGLRNGKGVDGKPIDQHVLHHDPQRSHGAPHRLMRGAQDIDAIDLLGLQDRHRPREVFAGHQLFEDLLALQLGELLRVVQLCDPDLLGHHYSGRDYRPSKWTAPRFIDPRYKTQTSRAKFSFVREVARHAGSKPLAAEAAR